jgi:LytTr DNA-binding domain
MNSPSLASDRLTDRLARYQPWRTFVEPGFWILFFCYAASVNTVVSAMDVNRVNLHFAVWELALWEWSSNLVLLALVPIVIAFERRLPMRLGTLAKNLRWHLPASVLYSLVHVLAMVAVRKIIYSAQGQTYDFGDWPRELLYEYLKDVRSYFGVIFIVVFYRLLLLRLQGEVSLLVAPDSGTPVEPIERPTRFLVKKLGKEFLLPAAEVEWLQAMGNYVNLHVRGREYPLRTTMTEIEMRLDPARFIRVHRSYILNVDYLSEIESLESGDARAKMRDGGVVSVSRRYRDNLRQAV